MRKLIKEYKGFSLVEMLLTILILSVVMLLVASTLNTVIKASNTANSKNLARSDINYIMDILNRSVTNSDLDYIYLYDSSKRVFELKNGLPKIVTPADMDLEEVYSDVPLMDGISGNEIHVKVYGYSVWTCFGYFRDVNDEYGYIVKATLPDSDTFNHDLCFSESTEITILHSFSIDATDFNMSYIDIGDGKNSMFIINATLTPLYWPVSNSFPVTREVSRQVVVSTEALTWY